MPNGVTYEGSFSYGNKHGYGVLTKADGSRYEGYFEDDVMHGDGMMYTPDRIGK